MVKTWHQDCAFWLNRSNAYRQQSCPGSLEMDRGTADDFPFTDDIPNLDSMRFKRTYFLSVILTNWHSEIYSDILLCSGIYFGLLSIWFYLKLSDIFWHSFWHLFWHPICHSFWHVIHVCPWSLLVLTVGTIWRKEEGVAPCLKSRDSHLAGGEWLIK